MRFPTMWYVQPTIKASDQQSDQSLCKSLEYHMSIKLLKRTLAKMPQCWKSHVTAQIWFITILASLYNYKSKVSISIWQEIGNLNRVNRVSLFKDKEFFLQCLSRFTCKNWHSTCRDSTL